MSSFIDEENKLKFILPIEYSSDEDVEQEGKMIKCEKCFKSINENDYQKHIDSHAIKKPYICNEKNCFKRFNTEENLNYHKKLEHNKNYIRENKKFMKEIKKNFDTYMDNNKEEIKDNNNVLKDYYLGSYEINGKKQDYIGCNEHNMENNSDSRYILAKLEYNLN